MKKLARPTAQQVAFALKFYFILVLLAFVRALMNYVFIIPNGFAPGGINGVSSIIYNAVLPYNAALAETVFNPAVTGLVLNIPLIIAAFIILDKKFAFNTMLVVTIFSLFMGLFSLVEFPQYIGSDSESGYMLLASLAGGAGSGIGLGLMLRYNMSLGGTDILGKIIYKLNPISDVQWLIFMCDCVIVVASGGLGFIGINYSLGATAVLTAVLSPILYSFLSLVATSEVADVIQSGMQSSLVFNIISDEHEEISERITSELHRGVTVVKSTGFYTGNEHDLLICVVRKKQINVVKRIIMECDPNAFLYITKAREVNGNGFRGSSG